jgi:polyadenylate-binding protein
LTRYCQHLLTCPFRIEDEAALKAKVDEALAVYDEYIKAQGTEGGEAKKEEETKA